MRERKRESDAQVWTHPVRLEERGALLIFFYCVLRTKRKKRIGKGCMYVFDVAAQKKKTCPLLRSKK